MSQRRSALGRGLGALISNPLEESAPPPVDCRPQSIVQSLCAIRVDCRRTCQDRSDMAIQSVAQSLDNRRMADRDVGALPADRREIVECDFIRPRVVDELPATFAHSRQRIPPDLEV